MRRILSIDGGGIKGVFAASFLSSLEEMIGTPAASYFDLIAGTSTGGIIALGLGMGLSARQILAFYQDEGPKIFAGSKFKGWLRQWGRAKYDSLPLRNSLTGVFGVRLLGESSKRLVIPSFNLETGSVYIWKTAHHPRLRHDYKAQVVDVALATAAAPTYFPSHKISSGLPLVDGGVWANNPAAIAVIEAIGVLGWPRDQIKVLSLGCTASALNVNWARRYSVGKGYWATRIVDVLLHAQQTSANGMCEHLLSERDNFVRVNPVVGNSFSLDGVSDIRFLQGLGDSEARNASPTILPSFFQQKAESDFYPCYSVNDGQSNTPSARQ